MSSSAPRHSVDGLSPLSSSPYRGEHPFLRPGSSSRYEARRGSTASSIHSIGGTLDTASHSHGISELSRNAISTLLQPPIVRTGLLPHTSAPTSSAHKPPTARDIPPVTLTNIRTIDVSEFKPYLTQVGGLYDALQRARENEDEGSTQLFRRSSKVDDFSDILELDGKSSSKRPNLSKKASLASLASSIETPTIRRRSSTGIGRRAPHAPTPLSTIPNVYFEEDFHLENPRTFDVVSERSEVVRPVPGSPDEKRKSNGNTAGPRKALATNAILQEKLSWYMDTIEVHLISSISNASTSFFAALGSLRELHSEAADSVSRIKALRKELEILDEEMAIGGLNIVNKRRRQENLTKLSNAIQQLKRVVGALATCESLVNDGEVDKALDAIDALEKVISGEEPNKDIESHGQLRDLRGATALQGVNEDLNILRLRVGKVFENRFLTALMSDLRHHVESVSTADTLQRWSNSSQRSRGSHNRESSAFPAYLSMSDEFRAELMANLGGLHRARHTSPATTAYREAVLREVRNIIRRPLPASNDDDADSMMSASTVGTAKQKTQQEKSTILARNLRSLDPEDAEELLKKTYIGVGETLRRLGTQVKMLLDVTSSLGEPGLSGLKSPPRSPNVAALDGRMQLGGPRGSSSREIQEEMHQTLDMSNLLGQAVDIAQDKIVKVLRVRSEQSTHLSVENFLRYFTLNLLFANECEAVSGRSGTALKNVVNGHIKDFVQQHGESERQSLATGMEADLWNAKDFTDDDKEHLARILSASTEDAQAWTSGSKIWNTSSVTVPASTISSLNPAVPSSGNSGTSTPSVAASKVAVRPAVIESESFLLPVSAILCLHGLSSFLHLNTGIPSMTTEISTSILSYLTLFNSRCTQLILGAGATRSAGLKNITTKHLALAAQALSFISSLIPHIREFARRHAGSGSAVTSLMGEFDKIRRAYLEHQQSIYDKLVDIMAGRAAAHAKSMKLIDWEKDTGKEGANAYMETLTKETSTLHRVLSKHLPEMTVRMIMEPVFGAYKEQWRKAFGDVVLESEAARSRMLKDAEHFKLKIGGLDGAGNAGEYIIGLIKDKKVPKLTKSGVDTVTTANDEATPSINGTGTEVANGADRDESKKSSDGTNGNAIKA